MPCASSSLLLPWPISHVIVFNGHTIFKSWRTAVGHKVEDIHIKMMRVCPENPQLWYAGFYTIMLGLSMMVCEFYGLQLPWWGMIVACALAWVLTLPICTMTAITGYGPGLNVITELVCGYMLPGQPITNMTFKCYCDIAMAQCMALLSDLRLGHYMKMPNGPCSSLGAGTRSSEASSITSPYLSLLTPTATSSSSPDGDPTSVWAGRQSQDLLGIRPDLWHPRPTTDVQLCERVQFRLLRLPPWCHPPHHPLGAL